MSTPLYNVWNHWSEVTVRPCSASRQISTQSTLLDSSGAFTRSKTTTAKRMTPEEVNERQIPCIIPGVMSFMFSPVVRKEPSGGDPLHWAMSNTGHISCRWIPLKLFWNNLRRRAFRWHWDGKHVVNNDSQTICKPPLAAGVNRHPTLSPQSTL